MPGTGSAIYHYSAQVIGRSSGQNAIAAAAYRSGMEIEDERTGEVKDYTRKQSVDFGEIAAPENSPEWVNDRGKLWNNVEAVEKRKDAQLCREVNAALPTALDPEKQKALVREFVEENHTKKGMVTDWNIHDSEGKNPHVHMMTTMRDVGPEGFGKKNREWNQKELLEQQREAWAKTTNRHLERAGHEARIDHRSLEAQGIDRVPTIHMGPKPHEQRQARANEINQVNKELAQVVAELKTIRSRREEVQTMYAKNAQARRHRRMDQRKEGPGAEREAWRERTRQAIKAQAIERMEEEYKKGSKYNELIKEAQRKQEDNQNILNKARMLEKYEKPSLMRKLLGKNKKQEFKLEEAAQKIKEAKYREEELKFECSQEAKQSAIESLGDPVLEKALDKAVESKLEEKERTKDRHEKEVLERKKEKMQQQEDRKRVRDMTPKERLEHFRAKREKDIKLGKGKGKDFGIG